MVNVIEEPFYVQVNYPTVFHTINSALFYGFMCRLIRSIPEAVWTKMRFYFIFQFGGNYLLCYPIHNGGDAQGSKISVSFGYKYLAYSFWKVTPTRHPVP